MKRVDIRAILADAEKRRELIVGTIVAMQAREGITTTREQAEQAYDRVRLDASDAGRVRTRRSEPCR